MRRSLAALAACCSLGALAPATTFSTETTADLVRRARRVCCVRCESVEARRDPRSGLVFTHVRLRLLEDLKGRSEATTIELRLVGGRADGVELVVAGMPTFRAGREAVLLLGAENREGYPTLLQAARGHVPLVKDAEGRRCLGERVTGIAELAGRPEVTLDAFRSAVRRLVEAQEREASK